MVIAWNSDFDRILGLELRIQWSNIVILQSLYRPENSHASMFFFVIDILNYEANILLYVVIRADVFIDLDQFTLSLSKIHAPFLNDVLVAFIRFAFKVN